jgi:predicted ATP-grasp superfamily ATP-dependent carboligase
MNAQTSEATALVLDGGSGPALAVTRSLGRAGWRVIVESGTKSALSRFATQSVALPDPITHPDAYTVALATAVARLTPSIVVPAMDATLELAWTAVGESTHVLGGDAATVQLSLDKPRTLAQANELGFPVPQSFTPASGADAHAAADSLGWPCVVKPRRSYVRSGDRLVQRRHVVVASPSALDDALASLADPDGALPMIQALVPGRALSVSVVMTDDGLLGAAARETLSFYPVSGGTSVWKRTIALGDDGVAQALDLLQAVGLRGLAEVEYQLGADGVPRLMEIGARAHGWLTLAIAAGVDLPLIAANAAIGRPPPATGEYEVGVEMRWLAGEVLRLRTILRGGAARPPGTTALDVVRTTWPPWKPGLRFDGIARDDLRPSFSRLSRLRRRQTGGQTAG